MDRPMIGTGFHRFRLNKIFGSYIENIFLPIGLNLCFGC